MTITMKELETMAKNNEKCSVQGFVGDYCYHGQPQYVFDKLKFAWSMYDMHTKEELEAFTIIYKI